MAFEITDDHQLQDDTPTDGNKTLGSEANIRFTSVGNKTVQGKVDTGATTSSIHATNISVNKERNTVTFLSPAISDNLITMDLEGAQEVHSADAGGEARPMVKFDIDVNGIPIQGVTFNLNDRSNMDTMVLIGQNILKLGDFQVDIGKDAAPERIEQVQQPTHESVTQLTDETIKLLEALQGVTADEVTVLLKIVKNMRTVVVENVN